MVEKLGIKEGFTFAVLNPPPGYHEKLGKLPKGVEMETEPGQLLDFVHFFTMTRSQLEEEFPKLKKRLTQRGMLWISWPKRSSGVATDVTEDVIRAVALPLGFVDVKVCAVDETWSGLKLMIRKENRK